MLLGASMAQAAVNHLNDLNCAASEVAKFDGANWACAEDNSALAVCPPGAPTRFVDNLDGTICDHETGLMWEKKEDAGDLTPDLDNPHDVENIYTWSTTGTAPDGAVFTDFLARLNGEVAGQSSPTEQLGGYSDWRLPTLAELQTILDCSHGRGCIDPIFGPTALEHYWSSTSYADDPSAVWSVFFNIGTIIDRHKSSSNYVRAVRGGR